ncbi:MAG: MerR family transcriptional regulator [Actinomycetota bacterium]
MRGEDRTRSVGELAEAAGLTVRTLHYYEEIELLVPTERTAAGHRRYGPDDVNRLFRICFLRRLGLPLADIAAVLDDAAWDLSSLLRRQVLEVEERLTAGARLRSRLHQLLEAGGSEATTETGSTGSTGFLRILEDMTMLETDATKRISILVYADIDAAVTHLTEVFGLGPAEIHRGDDGTIHLAMVQAGDGEIWLHPERAEFRLASPTSLGAATAMMAVMVDDVDEHHRGVVERGGEIVYEPTDQPYGYREYSARDHEGGFWSFMKPLPA